MTRLLPPDAAPPKCRRRPGVLDAASPYWAVLRIRFQMLLQYRTAAFAGFGTQMAFGLILVFVYEAFYQGSRVRQPMNLADVVTYVWLGQAFLGTLPWNIDQEIQAMVRDGSVSYELLRPVDLYSLWFARCIALRTAPTLLRAVPMFIVTMPFLGLRPPPSWAAALAWAASMAAAVLLGCAITTLLNISMLWTVSGEGIVDLVVTAVMLLSGMMLPLPLFPSWAQGAINVLPFRGLIDLPFRLYLGHIPAAGVWWVLAQQLAWTLALVLLGRFVLRRGLRRVVVQGG